MMKLLLLVADHLIELMGTGLIGALVMRYVAYKSGQRDQIYFKTFARGVEKTLESEDKYQKVEDIEGWLSELLVKVTAFLPDRTIRHGQFNPPAPQGQGEPEASFRHQNRETMTEFSDGKKSIIHGIKQQMEAFKSPHPPNFSELTTRVLDQDRQWRTIMGVSVEMMTRVLDILPGLFVVGGIFGTFIGIAAGLPAIGGIDMSRIQESAPVLKSFIDNIALSMRCSISGILFSVFMTILNALFPIHSSRADVKKTVERSFELIWYRIHGEKISFAEGRMIQLLEGIHLMIHSARGAVGSGQENRRKDGAKAA